MKVVSFYNRKGGVGKTTLSFMSARYLAAAGCSVIVIDLDPQHSITSAFRRIDGIPSGEPDKNVFSLTTGRYDLESVILEIKENLFLLPGHTDLAGLQSNVMFTVVSKWKAQLDSDYVIIDNAPNWTNLIQSSLMASDIVIIPASPEIEEIDQALWTYKSALELSNGSKKKIVLNRYDSEKPGRVQREVLEGYSEELFNKTINAAIPESNLVLRYMDTGEKMNRSAKAKIKFFECVESFVHDGFNERLKTEVF